MKFNEVYLGEAGVEASELQDGGGGGGGSPQGGGGAGGGGPLSMEQYICNAREALGVDSHYSRFYFVWLIILQKPASDLDVQRQTSDTVCMVTS